MHTQRVFLIEIPHPSHHPNLEKFTSYSNMRISTTLRPLDLLKFGKTKMFFFQNLCNGVGVNMQMADNKLCW
jgi:hypothetical protein